MAMVSFEALWSAHNLLLWLVNNSFQSYNPENLSSRSVLWWTMAKTTFSVLVHIVMKWGWYIILWNLGSWHQIPSLIPTVLQTSGADHSPHLVILLQFIKGIWCKEEAVWWKLILKVRAEICPRQSYGPSSPWLIFWTGTVVITHFLSLNQQKHLIKYKDTTAP